jgi:2,4-dienoyl-CoA reductase-like NADH-dependent reductase (Old Yellow Enzyme family)
VTSIRTAVPKTFVVGVKLNAADYVRSGVSNEDQVLQHVREIASWRMIDFIDVSGGNYENPGDPLVLL